MRMAQAIHAVRPGAIARGAAEDGRLTWRLGPTAAANGVVLDNAHDALADTRATLGIARVLRANAPDLFDHLIRTASKAAAGDLAASSELLFLAESRFGNSSAAVVASLGAIGSGGGLWAMFDLKTDPAPFLTADDAGLKKLLTTSPRPVRKAPLNKQPALFPIEWTPTDLPGGRLPLELYRDRAALLRSDPALIARITKSLETTFDDAEPAHVEQQIYRGFPSSADTALMARFHEVPWDDRPQILRRLEDPRARTFGLRLIAAERPDVLDESARTRWAGFLAGRWPTEEKVPWLTAHNARQDIAGLPADLARDNAEMITAYTVWLDRRVAMLAPG
jgi:exodeoxyribonuclease-1